MKDIPISPDWDDVRSYDQLKAESLFTVRTPGRRDGVAIVLEQTPLGLHGVTIGHDRYGITVDAEFSASDSFLIDRQLERGGYITRDTDKAVRDFLEAAGAF